MTKYTFTSTNGDVTVWAEDGDLFFEVDGISPLRELYIENCLDGDEAIAYLLDVGVRFESAASAYVNAFVIDYAILGGEGVHDAIISATRIIESGKEDPTTWAAQFGQDLTARQ